MVEETLAPGASVSVVARRHDVNANQVFTWRKQYYSGGLGAEEKASCEFVPVGVIGYDGSLQSVEKRKPESLPVMQGISSGSPSSSALSGTKPVITVSLRGGETLRIEGDVALPVLRCALKMALGQP